jgi:hypothetical protein
VTTLADRLSGLNLRSRSTASGRLGRRRARHRWQSEAGVLRLEERCMLSRATEGIPLPDKIQLLPAGDVMYQNPVNSGTNAKTFIITNNTNKIIFPVVEGNNSNSRYDPNEWNADDPTRTPGAGINQEYRVYAGYQVTSGGTTKNYLGVLPGATISITIPMAAWDSGRLEIVADTPETQKRFLAPKAPDNEPYFYDSKALQSVVSANATGETGMMLLYHATTPLNIKDDAPSQLLEYTIRDPSVPSGTFQDEIDYDVSAVNTMILPVALEAVKVVNGEQTIGYAGSTDTVSQVQDAMRKFADGTSLHGYFYSAPKGKGWPEYYLTDPNTPIDPKDLIKFPAGYNVFAESVGTSSYNTARGLLTSSQKYLVIPSNADNYAVRDMTDLWFSWLKYYLTTVPNAQAPSAELTTLMNEKNVQTFPINTNGPNWTLLDGQTISDAQFAQAFSTTVFNVMNTFSADPLLGKLGQATLTTQFLSEIIGGNIGNVFPDVTVPAAVQAQQDIIALMRGEPSTTYAPQGQPTPVDTLPADEWYSAPGDPKAGGVGKYNLNPFVWFIHKELFPGQYIYAYANDDQFGNIGVFGTSQLQVVVGGLSPTNPPGFLNTPYPPAMGT